MSNLLIITQKVDINDDILGFFHEWIREFSKKWDKVTVICLKLGEYNLPANVNVLSLGKERLGFVIWHLGFLKKLKYAFNFFRYIWLERNNYDAVFVHMNPRYILLGWPIWKLFGKKMSLWYAHGHVSLMLKVADKLTDVAFASTPEGYRLNSKKLKIVGQGIDIDKFKPVAGKKLEEQFKIITIGRISPSKDYETLIKATDILVAENHNLKVEIVGGIAYQKQQEYLDNLKNLVREKGLDSIVEFRGPVPNKDIVSLLQSADLFVNMGHTGSLDKANLEAMACGLLILTCNEAYENILGNYKDSLMYPKKDYSKLAEKIKYIINLPDQKRAKISADLREIVIRDHKLEGLISKITKVLNG